MARPVIGICTALERARWSVWDQQAMLLPRSFVDAVQGAGGLALMIPPDARLVERPGEVLQMLDGLMLAGGADIDPAAYGQEAHPETADTVPERDAFELALTREALAQGMPLLGICRGMQLINVARGGTLLQHLPERFGHHEHRRVVGSFDGADHDVVLREGSLVERVAKESRHATKSHHHQGVDRVGEGLVVSGTSTLDGLPEAIELDGEQSAGGFVLGVQWHPEADETSPIVGALVAAARDGAAARVARDGAAAPAAIDGAAARAAAGDEAGAGAPPAAAEDS
jgi:putative glutamine amidotransferase